MKRFFLVGVMAVIAQALIAQSEEVILKAMKDELQRNAKELSLPGYEKPFFIMYGLVDQKTMVVSGTLGSIINSNEDENRYKSTTRILVGNYEFNDESLEDNLFSQPNAMEIGLPLDDDYWGIRRSFWATTDNVYRSAARHFEKHKQTLKESGKPLAELPHRWFGQVPAQKMIVTQPFVSVNRLEWEAKVRELSGLFKTVPGITNSVVFVSFVQGNKYMVNTEGLEAKLPFSHASITVFVQGKEEGGKFLFDQISFEAKVLDKLPAMAQLRLEVERLIKRVEEEKKQPTLEEEYNGPILLEGAAVAQTFSSTLMAGREGLFASDNIAKLKGFQFEDESVSSEGKVGKSIMNALISIKAKPRLKEYNGVDLLGSFVLDNEGVSPADELTLVENGVLKNLLNNRTLTNANQTANGFANGPGVVEVTVAQKDTDKALRDKLLAQARKEGLTFALILRDEASRGGMMNAYKVDVATGKEQLVRNVNLRELGFKTWKRILGASSTYVAHNLGGAGFDREFGPSFTSWIVPTAVLLEEGEVQPMRMPSLKEEEYITSPLKSN